MRETRNKRSKGRTGTAPTGVLTATLSVALTAAMFVGVASATAASTGIFSPISQAASAASAGTNSDPIALKSYVDAQVSAVTKRVDALTTENETLKSALRSYADALAADTANPATTTTPEGVISETGSLFAVLQVESGQRMLLGAGSELVLRTGAAQAIRGEFGCVADLISGQDLEGEDAVTLNHLLVSSRDDNRGVRFTKNAYVLIKGTYTLR